MGAKGSKQAEMPHPDLVTSSGEVKSEAHPMIFTVTVLDAKFLPEKVPGRGECDPVGVITLVSPGYAPQTATTKTRNTNCPIWKQGFTFACDPSNIEKAYVSVKLLKDQGSTEIHNVTVPFQEIRHREYIDERYEMPKAFPNGPTPSVRIVFEVLDFAGETRRASADVSRRPSTSVPFEAAQTVVA